MGGLPKQLSPRHVKVAARKPCLARSLKTAADAQGLRLFRKLCDHFLIKGLYKEFLKVL